MKEQTYAIEHVTPERFYAYWREHERDALTAHWNFRVVWHEQRHDLFAVDERGVMGGLGLRIAASLAHIDALYIALDNRRQGIGRALVARAEEVAKYYNCHKMTLEAMADGPTQRFFEALDYKVEAVLPQHTFKLDVAVMRKFLL